MESSSRRERKKAETRRRISDLGTLLFMERGFDNVTIGEIAEAADVSKVTVFNHFPRKEDIFFDRLPELAELLTVTVRDRPGGTSVLGALRATLLRHIAEGHPLGGMDDRFRLFWGVILDSPALRARLRETVEEAEDLLASLIAEWGDDPDPWLSAALIVAGCRAAYGSIAARVLAGEAAAGLQEEYVARVNLTFDALERALAR
ncbi:TetR/AcrR family transcriptional regulator [Nonomuraea jiangxiensis]|uniref:DNA-binding transcriptional regulator, AcrR family n=1 Tax=Nonomuraea jiangxiensis TaxID=633440 RepID=A0A1G9RC30_9ACTN|nr:TetR/AcrR family transcriptional regulator [Nonomuraea jiangxiensis]SDM20816.1 DNA-binding transcriptional regulator, AcrR family [Nonomuraea jiangxiensis]